jgi:hypothetical protein
LVSLHATPGLCNRPSPRHSQQTSSVRGSSTTYRANIQNTTVEETAPRRNSRFGDRRAVTAPARHSHPKFGGEPISVDERRCRTSTWRRSSPA